MKKCSKCHEEKPFSSFNKHKPSPGHGFKDGYFYQCIECRKTSRLATKQKDAIVSKARRDFLRLEAIRHYSNGTNRCACCEEDHIQFLVIDHINGGGNAHRRAVRKRGIMSGNDIYLWLKRSKYPVGYRVLCDNCNSARGRYGKCPHEDEAVLRLVG